MQTARLVVDREFRVGEIDRRLYGAFLEHLGRAVYAVPGPVTSQLSEVPLALLRDGAGMIRGAEDLLVDLGRLDPEAARAGPGAGLGPESAGSAGPVGDVRARLRTSRICRRRLRR